MTDLSGKVAIVTGAADGLGRATSLLMTARGARVVLVDIDARRLEETARLIDAQGGRSVVVEADVADEQQVKHYAKVAVDSFGRIDAFFNNAGIQGPLAPLLDYPVEQFDRVMAVNTRGVFLGLQAVLPVMLEQKSGSIINTASMAAAGGIPFSIGYTASKHAVVGLTKTAALEVARSGVRVNAVLPGNIRTKMATQSSVDVKGDEGLAFMISLVPQDRLGEPEEIAEAVCFLASDASRHITGVGLPVDGGILAGSYGNAVRV